MLISKLMGVNLMANKLGLIAVNKAFFCQQPILTNTKARALYRTTISKVNTRSSSGKGIFTDNSLKRLIKKSNIHDIPLLFEAYYNFLGHFTPISNKTMDHFITSVIQLAKQDRANVAMPIDKILELLRYHDYLKYYPHYSVTKNCAHFIAQYGPDHYHKLLEILSDKIFIKLNKEVIETLFKGASVWGKFTKIAKIAAFRSNHNILEDLQSKELLRMISQGIVKFESIVRTKKSAQFQNFLSQFEEPSVDLALCWLITEDGLEKSAQIMSKIPENEANVHLFHQTVLKIVDEEESDVRGQLEGLLSQSHHAKLFK